MKYIILFAILLNSYSCFAQKKIDYCSFLNRFFYEPRVIRHLKIDTTQSIKIIDVKHIFRNCKELYNKPVTFYESLNIWRKDTASNYYPVSLIKMKNNNYQFWIYNFKCSSAVKVNFIFNKGQVKIIDESYGDM